MPSELQAAGAQLQKPTRFAPLTTSRFINGLWSPGARNVMRSPLSIFYAEGWRIGTIDAFVGGSNVELSERLTPIRRPGNTLFSTQTIIGKPDAIDSFHEENGTIRVLVDTAAGGSPAQTGSLYSLTPTGISTIISKDSGAGQGFWQGIGQTLYYGDGVDNLKWNDFGTGVAGNGTWLHGIVGPTAAPAVTTTPSGSAAIPWPASTFVSTMGLLSANSGSWALTSVNSTGTNTTQFGHTGDGQPSFNLTLGATTTDNGGMGSGGVTWTCASIQCLLWTANTQYTAGQCIFVPGVGGTPIPSFSGSGNGVTYTGTTGGGIFQAYIHGFSGGGTWTSGVSEPKWNPTTNTHTNDYSGGGYIQWQYLGPALPWQPATTYNSWWEHSLEVICYPTVPNEAMLEAGTQTIYILTANNQSTGSNNTSGTSGTGYTPQWATVTTVGQTITDGDLIWAYLGSNAWAASTNYTAWSAGTYTYSAIIDGNGNWQVCLASGQSNASAAPFNGWKASHSYSLNQEIAVQSTSGWVVMKVTTAGTSGSSQPTWTFTSGQTTTDSGVTWTSQGTTTAAVWAQSYGSQTTDGSVVWVNVGTAANSTWATNIKWNLPAQGFLPPTSGDPYGGVEVIANSDVQAVVGSGITGSSAPSWGTVGSQTTDNTATWYTASAATSNGISWQFFHNFCYAYKARAATDTYVTTAPPGWPAPLGPPTGSASGNVSSPSAAYIMVDGPSNGTQVITITGIGSTDPQVDTISIFATADGGSVYFWATDIPNPPPVNGQAQPWSFQYYLPDNATNTGTVTYPGLNQLVFVTPASGTNNPPPAGAINHVLHLGRLFVSVGSTVYASQGPDVNNPGQAPGNPYEAFYALRSWTCPSTVYKMIPLSSGLLVFTATGLFQIVGGPAASTLALIPLDSTVRLLNSNAIVMKGGVIYLHDAQRRVIALDASSGAITGTGKPIADLVFNLDPTKTYLAFHSYGTDSALYLADGSTGWYRCVPNMAPDGQITGPVWSTFATITGGCGAIASVETSPGVTQLLIGGASAGEHILARDSSYTTFTDNGVTYSAKVQIGQIVLANAGQMAECGFATFDFAKRGTSPSISWMADEIAETGVGTAVWTPLVNYIGDPPKLLGPTNNQVTLYANRYYFNQPIESGSPPVSEQPPPAYCRHMQVQVDFGTDSVMNELLTMTIFGAILQER